MCVLCILISPVSVLITVCQLLVALSPEASSTLIDCDISSYLNFTQLNMLKSGHLGTK